MQKSKKKIGSIFLIEGFSGSGKTTFSKAFFEIIKKKIGKTVVLSGDDFRKALNLNKYKKKDRIKNSHIFSKLINLLSEKNINVIFSIVGLNNEVRKIYKKNIKKLFLIFIDSQIKKILEKKKKNKVYKTKKNIVGIDIRPEFPKNPDFKMYNDFSDNFNEQITELVNSKKFKKFIKC